MGRIIFCFYSYLAISYFEDNVGKLGVGFDEDSIRATFLGRTVFVYLLCSGPPIKLWYAPWRIAVVDPRSGREDAAEVEVSPRPSEDWLNMAPMLGKSGGLDIAREFRYDGSDKGGCEESSSFKRSLGDM